MKSEACAKRLFTAVAIIFFAMGLQAKQDSCNSFVIFDLGNDGIDAEYTHSTSFYGPDGYKIVQKNRVDFTNDGIIDYQCSNTYFYDENHNVLMDLDERDPDLDGEIEILNKFSYTYDASGHILTSTVENDFENDGVFDNKSNTIVTYSGNRITTVVRTVDSDNDGVLESQTLSTYFYFNSYDLPDSIYTEIDNNGDGIFEGNSSRKYTYVFDMNGNPIHEETMTGTTISYYDRTFDSAGRVLTEVRTGTLSLVKVKVTSVYDAAGNLVEQTTEQDLNSDGIIENHRFDTFCPQFIAAFVVPTLGQWALMILALLMGIVGVVKVRQVTGEQVSF